MDLSIFYTGKIKNLLKQNDVEFLSLFGSSVRNGEKSTSDIDLLVRFSKKKSLLSFVRLERELGSLLGKKVDLVTENSLSPYLKESIYKEAKIVFDGKEG